MQNFNAVTNTPQNTNYLTKLGYKLWIKKAQHVNFFTQDVTVPGINVPPTHQPTPFVNIPYSGEHVTYEPLRVTFIVDAEMQSYFELHNWIRGLGKPSNFDEYGNLQKQPKISGNGLESDILVHVMSSTEEPKYAFVFTDAFPISLSGLRFQSTLDDVQYVTVDAVFMYTLFDIRKTNEAWG